MARRLPSPLPSRNRPRQVPFRVVIQHANEVAVAGDFNGWTPSQTRLGRAPDGTWSAVLELKPGVYEYRLMIDGCWGDDPGAIRRVPNAFGTHNCVLVVA